MDVKEFAEIVEEMALQHSYPGFDVRSLKLGLPSAVLKAPPKVFVDGLAHESNLTRIASLRWFYEHPGITQKYLKKIVPCFSDADMWVRLEAIRAVARIPSFDQETVDAIANLLKDENSEIRKAAATAVGKSGLATENIIAALKELTRDNDVSVKWKAQKALRNLNAYS